MFLLLSAQAFLSLKMRGLEGAWVEQPDEGVTWDPTLFKVVSFGQTPVAVDWLWIKAISDPGISHVIKGTHPKVYYDLDLATEIDPPFRELYWVGAHLLAVIRDDGEGARDLLRKGEAFRKTLLPKYTKEFQEKYWPNTWQLPLLLAYVELFELKNIRTAALSFKDAAAIEGSPSYLASLVRRFEKPGGEFEVGLRLLKFMHSGAKDPRVLDELERKMESLEVASYLFHLNRDFVI
ncbi:MAG: hypothetical protein AABZ55_05745, partial [Bdellovibrionota bacterium]